MTQPSSPEREAGEKVRLELEKVSSNEAEIPLLWPTETFIRLGGEELRPNLFTTQDATGKELCLRPEFTIPVCQHHISTSSKPQTYRYLGPIFRRLRETGTSEFLQAGLEKLGKLSADPLNEDAQILATAVNTLRAATDKTKLSITVGDTAILQSMLDGLGISGTIAVRLRRAYSNDAALDVVLDHFNGGFSPRGRQSGTPQENDVSNLVRSILESTAVPITPSRSPEAIAQRFAARSHEQNQLTERERGALTALRQIKCPISNATTALNQLQKEFGFQFEEALETFAQRVGQIEAAGIDKSIDIHFSGGFGQRFDYYTGFIFEVHGALERHIASGGRYDRLLGLLGGEDSSAIGFSIWIDRLSAQGAAS